MKKTLLLQASMMCLLLCQCIAQQISNPQNSTVSANDTCQAIDHYLQQLVTEKKFSGALLIIKNDKKLFSKGYGWANREKKIPFTSATLGSMGSITKAFTAAAIMKLVEQRRLSLNDNLKKFFPAVPVDKAYITDRKSVV